MKKDEICKHPLHNRQKGNRCGNCGEFLPDLDNVREETKPEIIKEEPIKTESFWSWFCGTFEEMGIN